MGLPDKQCGPAGKRFARGRKWLGLHAIGVGIKWHCCKQHLWRAVHRLATGQLVAISQYRHGSDGVVGRNVASFAMGIAWGWDFLPGLDMGVDKRPGHTARREGWWAGTARRIILKAACCQPGRALWLWAGQYRLQQKYIVGTDQYHREIATRASIHAMRVNLFGHFLPHRS